MFKLMPRPILWLRLRVLEEEEDAESQEKLSERIGELPRDKLAEDLAEAESSVALLKRSP